MKNFEISEKVFYKKQFVPVSWNERRAMRVSAKKNSCKIFIKFIFLVLMFGNFGWIFLFYSRKLSSSRSGHQQGEMKVEKKPVIELKNKVRK